MKYGLSGVGVVHPRQVQAPRVEVTWVAVSNRVVYLLEPSDRPAPT